MAKERVNGFIKWVDCEFRFGFIGRPNGSDLFFHFNGLRGEDFRSLSRGQQVEFSIAEGTKGLQASEVVRLV